jgi:hypothetical protein
MAPLVAAPITYTVAPQLGLGSAAIAPNKGPAQGGSTATDYNYSVVSSGSTFTVASF